MKANNAKWPLLCDSLAFGGHQKHLQGTSKKKGQSPKLDIEQVFVCQVAKALGFFWQLAALNRQTRVFFFSVWFVSGAFSKQKPLFLFPFCATGTKQLKPRKLFFPANQCFLNQHFSNFFFEQRF